MGTPHTPRQQSSGWIGLQDLDVEPTPAIRSGLPGARQLLDSLIATSRDYHRASGGHLCVFRDLAGLFVTAAYGVTLNHATSGGPDGWLGQVPVYIRVISPETRNQAMQTEAKSPQGHLCVVRISDAIDIEAKLFPGAFSRQDRVVQNTAQAALTLVRAG